MTKSRKPAPPQRRPSRKNTRAAESTANRAEDGYQAPDAEERREQRLLEELKELGYTISVRCLACGHPLTHPKSVARFIGPRCAAKAVDQ